MAAHNLSNAWLRRGAYTLPSHYGDPQHEALAARFSCVLADVSATEELCIEGVGAMPLLAAACGASIQGLAVGRARAVYWCADGGGVRGHGTLIRLSETGFLLRSADTDIAWFAAGAPRFGATLFDATAARGILMLAGPFAKEVLAGAGLECASSLEPDRHLRQDWSGLSVGLSREPKLGAYLIACATDDGAIVFDRLLRAGEPLGMRLAGQRAVELLHLEAGIALPHLDFRPARTPFASEPAASSLGLAEPEGGAQRFAGVQFDSDSTFAFALLFHDGKEVGRTLRSTYSRGLMRGVALAHIDPEYAAPGTVLRVRGSRTDDTEIVARVVALPFL
jgi:aminomethyltransferase